MTSIRGEDKEPGFDALAAGKMGKAADSSNHPVSHFTDVFVGRGQVYGISYKGLYHSQPHTLI